MNKRADKGKHKALEDLLKKDIQEPGLDDFERDALEGFRSLSPEEVFNLKEATDEAVRERLFNPARRRTARIWWAAAVFILLFGLGTYLIRQQAPGKEELAIQHSIEERNEVLSPAGTVPPASPVTMADEAEPEKKPSISKKADAPEKPAAAPMHEQSNPPAFAAADKALGLTVAGDSATGNSRLPVTENVKESDLPPLAAEPELSEKPAPASKKTRVRNEAVPAGAAAMDKSAESTPRVEYQGGEKQLALDLKEKFSQKELPAFDAVIYVKAPGTVEMVVFSKSVKLSVKQQKEVTDELIRMKKFSVNLPAGEAAPYSLRYRP